MLAFPLNVSNFKNLLPKPPRICQGNVFKQAHPRFHVTCPELGVANTLGVSDFLYVRKPFTPEQPCEPFLSVHGHRAAEGV